MKAIQPSNRPIEMLLVDDDEQEISAITFALKQTEIPVHLRVMRSGEEAISYLHLQDEDKCQILPKLILIEADHLQSQGFEVLDNLKSHHDLASIPVVLLTEEDHGILPSYYRGTCSVVAKPMNLRKLQKVLRSAGWN